MNVPSKPQLRKALEEIAATAEASLAAAKTLPVRASLIAPVTEGHARILGLARTAIGGQAWGGRPSRRT
jgi:hypothetical protein